MISRYVFIAAKVLNYSLISWFNQYLFQETIIYKYTEYGLEIWSEALSLWRPPSARSPTPSTPIPTCVM